MANLSTLKLLRQKTENQNQLTSSIDSGDKVSTMELASVCVGGTSLLVDLSAKFCYRSPDNHPIVRPE